MSESFRVSGVMTLDGSGFSATLGRAQKEVETFSHKVGQELQAKFAEVFAIGAMIEGVRGLIEMGDRLTELAGRTGLAVEELQRLDRATREHGATLEDMIQLWDIMNTKRNEALNKPGGTAAAAFAQFGIGPEDLTKSAVELRRKIALKFQTSENIEGLTAPFRAIGGRAAMKLAYAFRAGLDAEYQNIAVMSAENAADLHEMGEQWKRAANDLKIFFAPVVIGAAYVIRGIFTHIKGLLLGLRDIVLSLATNPFNPIKALKEGVGTYSGTWKDFYKEIIEEGWKRYKGIKERKSIGPPEFVPFGEEEKAKRERIQTFKAISSDALTAVGNFLGASRDPLARIASQQVEYLRMIEQNTRTTSDRDTLGIDGAD